MLVVYHFISFSASCVAKVSIIMFETLAWVTRPLRQGRDRSRSVVEFLWGQGEDTSKRETECVIKEAENDNANRKAG